MANSPFLGLRTCIYRVTDLAAATRWYTDALGFPPYFDQPFYVGFEVGGYELGLHPVDESLVTGNNVEVYWGVADVQTAYQQLLEQGATAYEAPNNVGDDIWVATVKDPWGNLFGLIQNPHFKIG
jgi:lactoylglutathione lyase